MAELNEDKLKKVTGGERREKTVVVPVQVENVGTEEEIDVKVYVDGEYRSELSRTIDSSITLINIKLNGTSGYKRLDVKFNNVLKKSYTVNFDNGTYIEIV